jgi:hypothetical protein
MLKACLGLPSPFASEEDAPHAPALRPGPAPLNRVLFAAAGLFHDGAGSEARQLAERAPGIGTRATASAAARRARYAARDGAFGAQTLLRGHQERPAPSSIWLGLFLPAGPVFVLVAVRSTPWRFVLRRNSCVRLASWRKPGCSLPQVAVQFTALPWACREEGPCWINSRPEDVKSIRAPRSDRLAASPRIRESTQGLSPHVECRLPARARAPRWRQSDLLAPRAIPTSARLAPRSCRCGQHAQTYAEAAAFAAVFVAVAETCLHRAGHLVHRKPRAHDEEFSALATATACCDCRFVDGSSDGAPRSLVSIQQRS